MLLKFSALIGELLARLGHTARHREVHPVVADRPTLLPVAYVPTAAGFLSSVGIPFSRRYSIAVMAGVALAHGAGVCPCGSCPSRSCGSRSGARTRGRTRPCRSRRRRTARRRRRRDCHMYMLVNAVRPRASGTCSRCPARPRARRPGRFRPRGRSRARSREPEVDVLGVPVALGEAR